MTNNYNSIARFYDALSKIVFQNSIKKAQQFLVEFIKDESRILIVGGGTGWILEKIAQLKRASISIDYVEKSSLMIKLAMKHNYKNLQVDFINQPIEDYNSLTKYNVVITPFLLDNFKAEKIQVIFNKLDALLAKNGLWLYADFVNNKSNKKWWQQFLLKSMYLFFRLTTRIESRELINVRPLFSQNYSLLKEKFFYGEFIQAVVYKRK